MISLPVDLNSPKEDKDSRFEILSEKIYLRYLKIY